MPPHGVGEYGDLFRSERAVHHLADPVVGFGVEVEEVAGSEKLGVQVRSSVEFYTGTAGIRSPVAHRGLHIVKARQCPELSVGVVVHRILVSEDLIDGPRVFVHRERERVVGERLAIDVNHGS